MSFADLIVPDLQTTIRRFAVAWRNPVRRSIHRVGTLEAEGLAFRFEYVRGIRSVEGFRPFIGFPDLQRRYESTRLWPFFDLRIMDRRRPDYQQYLHWLGLPVDSDRLDILARSGGEQKGDTVSLAEAPTVIADGFTETTFLVRGAKYAVEAFDSMAAANAIQPGQTLRVVEDLKNEANPDALLLATHGQSVGWIPDLLITYAREVIEAGGAVTVVQNNGPAAPWHMRLLVRLSGVAPVHGSRLRSVTSPPDSYT